MSKILIIAVYLTIKSICKSKRYTYIKSMKGVKGNPFKLKKAPRTIVQGAFDKGGDDLLSHN